jgi:hypothetical protein
MEVMTALMIALVAAGALASAAIATVKAGYGLLPRVQRDITAANGETDAIIELYAR